MGVILGNKKHSVAARHAERAGEAARRPGTRGWPAALIALLATLAGLALVSPVSAVIITGGPTYNLPGGGSCSVAGVPAVGSGATVSCTGLNLGAHTKVYFGIRNDINVNGQTMTGTAPAASSAAVFRYLSNTTNAITYTSTTSISDFFHGTHSVDNRLVLTRTAGSATIVAAGGNPVNTSRGDIQALYQITGGSTLTLDVDVQASDTFFANGNACPAVYDPSHANPGAGGDISKVDLAFYYSDCGDSQVDSPEQCDAGASNGTPGSCCTSTCQFRSGAEICRPGAGAPCDLSELCTGASALCPADDAPIKMGVVCRSGSGDVCDQNELCTGTPGLGCPPDDAPGNTTIVCRAGSVGDLCDDQEFCSGVPGATCPPDDAPGNINVICRPGSGDVCDPLEQCTGIPGQYCPPNIVANPTTVCRTGSGDICDPSETCTAVPGQPCPPNVVAPTTTVCRSAIDACDLAEQCTGAAGVSCPVDSSAPAQTPCDADNDVCTVDECNGSGTCVFDSTLDCEDGNVCTQDSCDPQSGCVSVGAPAVATCVPATKAVLKIKDLLDDSKDNVRFVWKGGPALVLNMGDPTQTTRYELCVYDDTGVQMAMGVDPGTGWSVIGPISSPKGYKFKDKAAQQDGVKLIKTKGSNLDKGKAKVSGKGGQLPDTATLPFVHPVTAQLYASDGMCWEAEFEVLDTLKNQSTGFTGKIR